MKVTEDWKTTYKLAKATIISNLKMALKFLWLKTFDAVVLCQNETKQKQAETCISCEDLSAYKE